MQPRDQQAHTATMAAANGPVDGTPIMANMPHPRRSPMDPREQLNTYIYDYFLRNGHNNVARAMIDSPDMKMATGQPMKPSPNNRPNGVDSLAHDDDFPQPQLPANQVADNSFLLDWWVQFWDIFQATKTRTGTSKGAQYVQYTRSLAHMQTEQRNTRMMMTNPMNAQYQPGLMRGNLPNGVASNDLKRAAVMNNRPNGNAMAGMPMKNPMMAAHMQRDPSGMDVNGQRAQSPGSNDNAPSPNKRPRVDGPMNAAGIQATQFGEFGQQNQAVQPQKMEGMNSASPMTTQQQLDDQHEIFAGNGPPRQGMSANASGAPQQGNHALQDYQMQLMLLEQQNKKRLLMARQEQDNLSGPHQAGAVGAPAFGTAMSPQGSRAVPSPNPADPRNRGTPKIGQPGPGSPMPEGVMPQQRGSPAPGMAFDPGLAPPGMPPQFFSQMNQNPLMRPPSSHPVGNFNPQQVTQQQIEAMRNNPHMQNGGVWRGPPQQGMMPGQQMNGPMGQTPQQRHMPPPAPPEQPRPEPSPSLSNQAPPTPSQTNKNGPKKKLTKDTKAPNKKGANAATPAQTNGDEPPTPTTSTPVASITPGHSKPFNQGPNGGLPPNVQAQPPPQQQMDTSAPPFGPGDADPSFDLGLSLGGFPDDTGGLENFDFDSFLQTGNENDTFNLTSDFDFNNATEVGGDM